MLHKVLLLKISFWLTLLMASFHTFFILIGGPPMPTTPDFLNMHQLMHSVPIDSGAGIMRTMQNFMDGFNIIVSIFLISLPSLALMLLPEIKGNKAALVKLTSVYLTAMVAFFITSFCLLAIGGTIISGLISLLLLISLFLNK